MSTVYLHIGEPKTGTTFLQQVMWGNRSQLAAQGLVLPGHHPQDHFRAAQDLRGIPKLASDPAGSWEGEWDILAAQARGVAGRAVISHELLSAATREQAARAVASLGDAEVHLVITVRDIATLIPAEWQETVKHRNARGWLDWIGDIVDREYVDPDREQFWFWRVHDTLAILDRWGHGLPAGRVHVITVPPAGSGTDLLWKRFAGVVGVATDSADLSTARPNASLGLPEIEMLRRVNAALSDEVPGWYYMWNVKETLAHGALARRPKSGRLVLPPERSQWASSYSRDLVDGLRTSGYDIVGELDELTARTSDAPGPRPEDVTAEQMLDAAVESVAALVLQQYRRRTQRRPQRRTPTTWADRLVDVVQSSPRLKQTIRALSSRSRTVARLRVIAWRALEQRRGGSRRHGR